MSIKETILEVLGDMHPDIDFESEQNLVTDKVLDSFDLISLATELSDEFDVKITAKQFVKENFENVEALTAMIETMLED